jgi:predicted DNA-binding antitoxin AbrB/MazE fold protein
MQRIEAQYEDGILRPARPLSLRPGERVAVIVMRQPDRARWDLMKLGSTETIDDVALVEAGLEDWARQLEEEDKV